MKQINGFWIDENNNKWSIKDHPEWLAQRNSDSLKDCHYCVNCSNCINCTNCISCDECSGCENCNYCWNCWGCKNCSWCVQCRRSKNFLIEPEKYTTFISDDRINYIYFYYGKTNYGIQLQICCDIFVGNLTEFEEWYPEYFKNDNDKRERCFKAIEKAKILFDVFDLSSLTQEQLNKILENHDKWVKTKGLEGKQALLAGTNLSHFNLSHANLAKADLSACNLTNADLSYTDLTSVDLRYANLKDANFESTILKDSDLRYTENIPDSLNVPLVCPEKGEFFGFKKVLIYENNKAIYAIAKLRIPEEAKRSSGTSSDKKCRCSKAEVLEIRSFDERIEYEKGFSAYEFSNQIEYKKGKIIEIEDFDEDRWNECSTGIHFFMTREEAINY